MSASVRLQPNDSCFGAAERDSLADERRLPHAGLHLARYQGEGPPLLSGDTALAFLGPILGLVVVLAFLGTAAWLIRSGFRIERTILGSVDIVSLAAVFVVGVGAQRSVFSHETMSSERGTPEALHGHANWG